MVKSEARIIGIDDAPFDKFKDKTVLIVGTIFRGGDFIDGILSTKARVDGKDSTNRLIKLINECKFKPQLQLIMLKGIAVGGFNVIDVEKLSEQTKLPVIIVIRDYPDYQKIYDALHKIGQKDKIKLIEKLPKPAKINHIYVQHINISFDKAKEFVNLTCTRSYIPEPLRVAHLIASGIKEGESRGGA